MSIKISHNNHHHNPISYSSGTLGARIEKNKRALFHEIAALIQDDDLAGRVEEIITPFLLDLEALNFSLGMYAAKQLSKTDPAENNLE